MSSHHLHKAHKELNGISLFLSGDVAIIVMNRGENRLNLEFVETFNNLLDEVERIESCKSLITTGTGKFYGNGLDLEWMAPLSMEDLKGFIAKLHALIRRILCFPLPTLAALNGHTYAGAALLAFAHDLRTFRLDKGWLCLNEVFIERRFANFHLSFLKTKLGNGKNLHEALVLGRRYTAEDAFKSGLVHAIPSETMLITESIRVLKSFCGKTGYPRQSLVNMKEDVYRDSLEVYENELQRLDERISKL